MTIPITEPRLEQAEQRGWWSGFALGLAAGVLGMLLVWWTVDEHRQTVLTPEAVTHGRAAPPAWVVPDDGTLRPVVILPTCEECIEL